MIHTESLKSSGILFPLSPALEGSQEEEIYVCFMRYVRQVPNSRMAIKILSAIQFTADTLSCSDAHVSKVLVELGLRAPRLAFPIEFLLYVDRLFERASGNGFGPSEGLRALRKNWDVQGLISEVLAEMPAGWVQASLFDSVVVPR